MKLRLLNASHQALCYPGLLFGYKYVHETMEDEGIRTFIKQFMDREVSAVVDPVEGVDIEAYKKTLIERFANPAIRDQLSRIGTYGSSGIPKFLLPSVKEQLAKGGSISLMALTVALWFRYLSGLDESGKPMPMHDALADKLRVIATDAGTDPRPLLAVREVFGQDLATNPQFISKIERHLQNLYKNGVRNTIRSSLS